jgi:DNA polymerase family A
VRFVVADWETFFDSKSGYTLKKMSTESYIRDPRFEAHGCSVKWGLDYAARWYTRDQIKVILAEEDWSDVYMIHHHGQFDSLIESHHYGVYPKMIGCTLAMSRMMIGNHISVSLDSVRKHFGLSPKTTPYSAFDGKHWNELSPQVQEQMALGACDEVESIWTIFGALLKQGFPREELEIVDTTIKMFSMPRLRGDPAAFAKVWEDEATKKNNLLEELQVDPSELQSAQRFRALLEAEGIEPETKEGKNGPIDAFAKTDEFMKNLLEDENPRVRALAQARLGIKSTLLQTRAETLGWMARRGPMCVYLRYCGAHTTRWSGGDAANWQNSVTQLNECISAPEGFWIASPDASQVECRLLNFVAGQHDVIKAFRAGRDVYAEQASKFYGRKITKATDYNERQMFRIVELQAGYGSGAAKIKATIRNKEGIIITDDQAEDLKTAYRHEHDAVVRLWEEGNTVIQALAYGREYEWGPVRAWKRKLWFPNGGMIHYDTLQWHRDEEIGDAYWRLRNRHGWSKIYGTKLVENLIQGLARVVVSQAMIRIKRMGFHIFNMRHDDIGILILKGPKAEDDLERCKAELRREPTWLPGIPLDCEGSLSSRYEK